MIANRPIRLEVDGGVNSETAQLVAAAGADTLVAGSAVFKEGPKFYARNIASIRAAADAGAASRQLKLQKTNLELEEEAKQLFEQNAVVERKNHEVEQARQPLEEKAEQLAATTGSGRWNAYQV